MVRSWTLIFVQLPADMGAGIPLAVPATQGHAVTTPTRERRSAQHKDSPRIVSILMGDAKWTDYLAGMEANDERLKMMSDMLRMLALSGQPCDVCTHSGARHVDVTIDPDFVYALMYGAGPSKLAEMLKHIKLQLHGSPVASVAFDDIWVIYPMPKEGISDEQLQEVDMREAERSIPPSGETVREIIRNTYRPKDEKELDYFVRRYLAS